MAKSQDAFHKTNALFNGANSSPRPDHAQNSHATLAPKRSHAAAVEWTAHAASYALRRVCAVRFFESDENRDVAAPHYMHKVRLMASASRLQ
jgi:hypothetical protein